MTHGNGPQVGLLALQAAAGRDRDAARRARGGVGRDDRLRPRPGARQRDGRARGGHRADAGRRRPRPIRPSTVRRSRSAPYLAADREAAGAARRVDPGPSRATADYCRRVVASPEPRAIIELEPIRRLSPAGVIVICAGGGGVPVARTPDGSLAGVEAVVDKDLTAALLATDLDADALLLLTDVDAVHVDHGMRRASAAVATATPDELRALRLPAGSMAPKAEAAARFVAATGAQSPPSAASRTRPPCSPGPPAPPIRARRPSRSVVPYELRMRPRPSPDGSHERVGHCVGWHATRIPTSEPLRVVVAGAGVGGLETMVALRGLVGHRVALTLVAPQDDFTVHALEVFEPFGRRDARSAIRSPSWRPISTPASATTRSRASSATTGLVHLQSGDELRLRPRSCSRSGPSPTRPTSTASASSARTTPRRSTGSSPTCAAAARSASRSSLPPGCTWTLPAYELALMVAALATPRELTLVTYEHEPLSAFGAPARRVGARGARRPPVSSCSPGVQATVPHPTIVQLAPGATPRVRPHRPPPAPLRSELPGRPLRRRAASCSSTTPSGCATATMCSPSAMRRPGPTSRAGWPRSRPTSVAEQIAWQVGAEHPPRPYRPVLRGLVRTADGPRYLRAEPPGATHVGRGLRPVPVVAGEQGRRALADAVARGPRPRAAARRRRCAGCRPAASAASPSDDARSVIARTRAADRSRWRPDAATRPSSA